MKCMFYQLQANRLASLCLSFLLHPWDGEKNNIYPHSSALRWSNDVSVNTNVMSFFSLLHLEAILAISIFLLMKTQPFTISIIYLLYSLPLNKNVFPLYRRKHFTWKTFHLNSYSSIIIMDMLECMFIATQWC